LKALAHSTHPAYRFFQALLLLLVLLPAILYFALGREAVSQTLLPLLVQRAGLSQVQLGAIHGSLWGPLTIDRIDFKDAKDRIQVQQLELDWQPWQLLRGRLVLHRLQAERVNVESMGGGQVVFPSNLGLPFELQIATLQVQQLDWGMSQQTQQQLHFQQITLALLSQGGRWELQRGRVLSPWGALQAAGSLQHVAPFALAGSVTAELNETLAGALAPQVALKLGGNLRQIHLDGRAQGEGGLLQAQVDLTLFDSLPVSALKLNVENLNPARWQKKYPQADINLALDLQHTGGRWRGQLQMRNADNGQLDAQRLPLQGMSANVAGTGAHLQLEKLLLDLGKGGQFRGKADWDAHTASQFQFVLHTDNLNLQAVHSRLKATRIEGDLGLEKMTLSANLAQQGLRLDFQASLAQQVLQVKQARLRLNQGQLAWSGELDFAGPMKFQADGQVLHFDPSRFGQYPVADLNGDIKVKGQLLPEWQVNVQSDLRPSRLMQRALSGRVSLQADAQRVQNLDLNVRFGVNSVRAKGDLGGVRDQLSWQVDGTDLAAFGWGGAVQAQGVVSGGFARPQTTIEMNALVVRKSGRERALADGSVLRAQGQLLLRPPFGGNLSLNAAHLNPAAWGDYPAANLNAKVELQLDRADRAGRAGLDLHLEPSTLMGLPLGGKAKFQVDKAQMQGVDVALSWGKNSLSVKQLAGLETALDWALIVAQLPAKSSPPASDIAIKAQGRLQGTLRTHTLQAQATVQGVQTDFFLSGAWMDGPDAGRGWQASLQRWRTEVGRDVPNATVGAGITTITLQAPVKLQWEQANKQFTMQAARFDFDGGTIQLDGSVWNPREWRSKGRASGVPLTSLAWLEPGWKPRLGGGLRFGFLWDLASAEHLNGRLHLTRESGDWRPGRELPQGVGLETLQAEVNLKDDALQLQLDVNGKQIGQAHLQFGSRLARRDGRWGLPGNSPLTLQGDAQFDSIAWLAGLTGGQITCSGNLALKITGGGSIGAPVFSGDVVGEALGLRWINEGLVLRNGALRAQWNGPNLQIQDLHFDGVQAQGALRFADAQTSLRLTAKANQLTLLSRPDRLLVVSGQSEFEFDAAGLRLSGNLKADRAQLELVAQDTPALSDDIRLFRDQRLQEQSNPTLPLRVDLGLDLGNQFQVRGQGLDVRLAGKLHWQALARRGPRLIGEVQAVEGTYTAYGKKLKLERSSINFSGAWDNPGLNIRAFRQRTDSLLDSNTEPDVGVELSGTLLAPQAKLVSTPALPDSEKLAYLVLGHGLEGANGQQELDILSAASTALLGGANENLTSNLTNKLGLDDLGVSFAKGVDNAVLTLGKRLSRRAYLSFEQGVGSASGLVKLRYSFNSRLSVQLQGGSNNAADAFYSFRFD
jgi:translocation and assembly module TamB